VRRLAAVAVVVALLLAGCGKNESPSPSPEATKTSAAGAPSSTNPPAVTADENAYLSGVYANALVLATLKPAILLQKGYEVCPEMQKGWAWDFIKKQLAEDTSLESETEPVAVSAALHLCAKTQAELDQYIKTHVPVPQPGGGPGE
jgi:hypothetical protein